MLDKINMDLTNALKNSNKFELSVLRMLKSALKNESINKKAELTDEEILSIIKKQVKIRRESQNEYINYNRSDIADGLAKEIVILSKYLPQELTAEETNIIVDDTISEIKPDGIKSMGVIIKAISAKFGTSVDMQLVSKLVKEKLNNMSL